MNVVQVGTGFVAVQPHVTGGVEKYVHNLSVSLQTLGHNVTVIDMPAEPNAHTPYRRVKVPIKWRRDFNLVAHAIRGLSFGQAAAWRLKRLIQQGGVDLVNFHSQFTAATGIPMAHRYRVPTVFTMHNPLWSDTAACQSVLERIRYRLEWSAESRADCVIGLSESVTDNRVQYFGLRRSRAVVVPVGVDEVWFEHRPAGPLVRQKYAPNGEAIVLQVGRVAPYKNQLTLVKAFPRILALMPRTRAVFVGPVDSHPYLRILENAAAQLGVARNVAFAGYVPFGELIELYGLASVVVLPSLRENCPQAALDALAQGKSIVASDIPPLREVLPNGTGVRVSALDHEALAAAVVLLLTNERLRTEIGAKARAWAHCTYRWDAVSKRIVSAYAWMLQRERRSVRT